MIQSVQYANSSCKLCLLISINCQCDFGLNWMNNVGTFITFILFHYISFFPSRATKTKSRRCALGVQLMLLFHSHAATESDGKCRLDIIRLKQCNFLASFITVFHQRCTNCLNTVAYSQDWQVLWSVPISFSHEVKLMFSPTQFRGLKKIQSFPTHNYSQNC